MLRKKESKSISKTLVLSVVICVLLQFFYFGLATGQDDTQLDAPILSGVPGEMEFTSSMEATSELGCEACDDECVVYTRDLYVDEVLRNSLAIAPCAGWFCDPGPYYVEVCFENPEFVGLSETEEGPFTDSIVMEVYMDATETVYYPFYVKGLKLTELNPVTKVVNWPSGWTCDNPPHNTSCCCMDWNVVPSEFAVFITNYASSVYLNPEWAGPGYRIFPGKKEWNDQTKRETVKIQAVNAPCTYVHFVAIDIDDPASSYVIDPNDILGGDNNDNSGTVIVGSGTEMANLDGTANWYFDVSMQPGDNFRFAASCNADDLSAVIVSGTDIYDANEEHLPTESTKITRDLTVWRQLHIELDSMGIVTGNHFEGSISKIRKPQKNQTILEFDKPYLDKVFKKNFQNGAIYIRSPYDPTLEYKYNVKDNGTKTITVDGILINDFEDEPFRLYDDDDFYNNDEHKRGDEGEDVPVPDISFMQNSDYPEYNRFASAYIKPVYYQESDTNVPFHLKVDETVFANLLNEYFDNINSDQKYWTAYLLGGYEPWPKADNDPNGENKGKYVMGLTLDKLGSIIFHETIGEEYKYGAYVAVHEIAHVLGAGHVEVGIMQGNYPSEPLEEFSAESIKQMRSYKHP